MYIEARSISYDQVTIHDPFWSEKMRMIREKTLPHLWSMFEASGRFRNFERAAGKLDGEHEGMLFDDGLFYTGLEGACWMYKQNPDPKLAQMIDDAADQIIAMQQPDGYLNSFFLLVAPEHKWSDILLGHELYTSGTFFEAAAAHYAATGSRKLVEAACRLADLIDSLFGPGKRPIYSGHEEIELGLLRLYEVTDEIRYVKLCEFLVEMRGNPAAEEQMYQGWSSNARGPRTRDEMPFGEYGRSRYMQAHLPVKKQETIEGHAVRATYLFSAVTELAGLTNDTEYADAVSRLWDNMVNRRMYLTGGVGDNVSYPPAGGFSVEGFSSDYNLPNDKAYCETCASIGIVFWGSRMNRLFGDAKYADVMERVLYNALLAGISLNGEEFFYTNVMEDYGVHRRRSNLECACCPPNLLRFFPKLSEYIYVARNDHVYVNLFIGSETAVQLSGTRVCIQQHESYLKDGHIELTVRPEMPSRFSLHIRVPAWCSAPVIKLNGMEEQSPLIVNGYAVFEQEWTAGDSVQLHYPPVAKQIVAHPHIQANTNKTALMLGPLVYCIEQADHGMDVKKLALPRRAQLTSEFNPDLLGGVHIIKSKANYYPDEAQQPRTDNWQDKLYSEIMEENLKQAEITLVAVPYFTWANREPGSMTVWIQDSLQGSPIG